MVPISSNADTGIIVYGIGPSSRAAKCPEPVDNLSNNLGSGNVPRNTGNKRIRGIGSFDELKVEFFQFRNSRHVVAAHHEEKVHGQGLVTGAGNSGASRVVVHQRESEIAIGSERAGGNSGSRVDDFKVLDYFIDLGSRCINGEGPADYFKRDASHALLSALEPIPMGCRRCRTAGRRGRGRESVLDRHQEGNQVLVIFKGART